MGAINKITHPELYSQTTISNARRQISAIYRCWDVGRTIPFRLNAHIVGSLHTHAMLHLVEEPGSYRREPVHIKGSSYEPPSLELVQGLMGAFYVDVRKRWETNDKFLLAAFVLWRLVWIHPFEDGNGRTARAAAYLVLCLKDGRWYPGRKTLLSLLRENEAEYIRCLQKADRWYEFFGDRALLPLAKMLARLMRQQLLLATVELASRNPKI